MKKFMKKGICTLITLTTVCMIPQFSFAADPLPLVPPADAILIAQDNFTAPDSTKLEDYTDGTGFVQPIETVSTAYAGNYLLTTNCVTNKLVIKNNQLTTASSQGNGGFNVFRGLTSPIDLNVDAEYYISFRTNLPYNQKDSSASIGFGTTTNNQQQHGIGIAATNGVNNSGIGAVGPVSYTTGQAIFGSRFSKKNLTSNTMYTVVARLSTRTGKQDIMRVKSFADGEQPTFNPTTWDIESCTNTTGIMSWLRIGMNNGTGSGYFPILDDISVYKSAPIYVTKTYDGEWTLNGQTVTISVPATNIFGNSQTIQSIEWTKTDGSNTTVVNTTTSYVIPDDMVGKHLDVKVELYDSVTGITAIHHPLSQYIRANYDVAGILYSKVSTNGDSALNATLTNNTNIQANVYLARNDTSSLNATTAPAIIVLAHYDADNKLKSVSSIVCDTSKIWTRETYRYAVTLPSITIESGDYFRTYVWNTIDGLKPINVNRNTVNMPIYELYPLNLN